MCLGKDRFRVLRAFVRLRVVKGKENGEKNGAN